LHYRDKTDNPLVLLSAEKVLVPGLPNAGNRTYKGTTDLRVRGTATGVPTRDQPREACRDGLDPLRQIRGARLVTREDVRSSDGVPSQGRRLLVPVSAPALS